MVRAVIPGHSEHVQRTLMNTAVFDNTRVLTCDAGHTVAEAIAIRAGKVLAVGTSDTARASAGPYSRIVDQKGCAMIQIRSAVNR
jgi:predicted amidohydrolase YtcJ